MRRGYARAEERNAAVRASLEPLAPGERPGVVTFAAVLAALLAAANLVLFAAGVEVQGEGADAVGVVLFAVLMGIAAWGMWRCRYWAVLGFQALLMLSIVIAGLSLFVADNLWAVVLCLGVLIPGGLLFWRLVRALARLQMPERP